MGCFGDREKGDVEESQKWEYVTLSDFHATGSLTFLSYIWLWVLALIAVAVYGADTFTAVNLLVFDKWSGSIEPAIPLKYAKWIFAVCIIISWALCIFEWVRAIRVIRRGGVAESYMDSLAVTLQSMRSQGWRRFLVFAELTKSKKGLDYMALFVYFSFKGALRIILAETPRQVVNAITLYSFMQSDLLASEDSTNRSSFDQFWANVESLAETNREEAVVLFTMLFTLIIWVISTVCLIIATTLYLLFLWHYIPQKDGRLSIYCRRKIDRRLEKIVGQKVKQALEDQEKKRMREEAKAAKSAGELPVRPSANRKPTLPQIGAKTPDMGGDAEFGLVNQGAQIQNTRPPPPRSNTAPLPPHRQPTLPDMREPGDRPSIPLNRTFTAPAGAMQRQPTLPDMAMSEGQPGTPSPARTGSAMAQRQPTLPEIDTGDRRRPMPFRSDTEASAMSNVTYSSDAPLLNHADEMGYSDEVEYLPAQPRPVLDRQTSYASARIPPPLERQGSYATSRGPPALDRQASYATVPSSFGRQSPYVNGPMPLRSMTTTPQRMDRLQYDSREESWQHQPEFAVETTNPVHQEAPHVYGMPTAQVPQERLRSPETISPQRQRPPQNFQRPFSPLARTTTGLSFSSRQEPEPQSFEMTPQPRPIVQQPTEPSNNSNGYVAFNPSFATQPRDFSSPEDVRRPTLPTGPQRSFTSPPEEPRRPTLPEGPQRSFTSPPEEVRMPSWPAEPQRCATAPPVEHGHYDDLLDEYGSDGSGIDAHPHVQAHARSATPGGRW